MDAGFSKAISREGHTYQGVVFDLDLPDEDGECASVVTRVAAGDIVFWREDRRGMVEVLLGETSLYLPRWYFKQKFQELPALRLGQRYLTKEEFLELKPSGYHAYVFASGKFVPASGGDPALCPDAYGQEWVAVLEAAAMVTMISPLGTEAGSAGNS